MRNTQFYAAAIFLWTGLTPKVWGRRDADSRQACLLGLSASLMTHRYLESGGLPMIFLTSIASVVAL